MDAESYKLTIEVLSDAIKILGPAIITAIVGYKVGKSQLLMKVEELNKNNEFKARDRIFAFHKEKLEKVDESIASLNNGLGEFAGMTLADLDDTLNLSSFINKYLVVYINNLPFQLSQINDEVKKHANELSREYDRLQRYIKLADNISIPENPKDALTVITELLEIYGFASHCLRILIEKEALEIFKPYTSNA